MEIVYTLAVVALVAAVFFALSKKRGGKGGTRDKFNPPQQER